jgi:hypothetical protein
MAKWLTGELCSLWVLFGISLRIGQCGTLFQLGHPVAGFSGNASRATHRGDLNARVHRNEYINLVDVNSTLVVPDCVRRLYSVRQATHKGYRVILDSNTPDLWV